MSVKPCTQLRKVFEAYAECKLVPAEELKFIYKDNRLQSDSTPQELGMGNGDVIECRLQQAGC
jgi:small ubiquitin-related modifier